MKNVTGKQKDSRTSGTLWTGLTHQCKLPRVRQKHVWIALGILLVFAGLAWASALGNPRYPQDDFNGVMRQTALLVPIMSGAALVWWGANLTGPYLVSLDFALVGLAFALWGPEWGCGPCDLGSGACVAVACKLPGSSFWLALAGSGITLAFATVLFGRRRELTGSQPNSG